MSLGPKGEYERKFYALRKDVAVILQHMREFIDNVEESLGGALRTPEPDIDYLSNTLKRAEPFLLLSGSLNKLVHTTGLMGLYQIAYGCQEEMSPGTKLYLAIQILEAENLIETIRKAAEMATEATKTALAATPTASSSTEGSNGSADLEAVIRNWKTRKDPGI